MSRPTLPKETADVLKEWLPAIREFFSRFVMDKTTWNPPNVGANSVVSTTLTTTANPEVIGLRPEMAIVVTPPSDIDDDLTVEAWCATTDTLTIRLRNDTGGAINQGEGVWSFVGVRP